MAALCDVACVSVLWVQEVDPVKEGTDNKLFSTAIALSVSTTPFLRACLDQQGPGLL